MSPTHHHLGFIFLKSCSMEEDDERELELLLPASSLAHVTCRAPKSAVITEPADHPSLDLSLSMSVGPWRPPSNEDAKSNMRNVQALKQQTAEQIRLAAVEKAYAERVRELTRRELELAEKEFARARMVWERAREEVERVERMKDMATRRINSTCMEITCQACRQRFRP
ncbi:zinc finger protein SHOOT GRAVITROPISM 5 [Phoenix dactylifera]|uniref:Zinc finger protein SHOOT GRAVITROPISM 5 n=1 Tax=Phoenix dactylifera TaxID=42345 RepID=A0A8B7CS97_PHODC|nr:zinc finger protein SHOOT GRAVITROPISM 5 [Phoenix dactylifera]